MLLKLSAPNLASLFCVFLSTMAAGILFYQHNRRAYIKWLALSYLMICFSFFVVFLLTTKLILDVPHFYKTGAIFGLLYMPFSYMYMRTALTKKGPGRLFWLHMLPACLFIADHIPLFFSSASDKIAWLQADYSNSHFFFRNARGSFLPVWVYRIFFAVLPVIYWLSQVYLLIRQSYKSNSFFKIENEYWVKWLLFYLVFQIAVLLPVFLIYIHGDVDYMFNISYIFAIISSMFIILSVFVHPEISHSRRIIPLSPETTILASTETSYQEEAKPLSGTKAADYPSGPLKKMPRKQIGQMKSEIESFLERNQPFLKHGYSLQEMATSLNYPLYQLSALINQEYSANFNELINKYRIDYAIHVIKQGKYSNLNINGLADQCGFSNRNSFTNAFKKFTGFTPSEYFKVHNT